MGLHLSFELRLPGTACAGEIDNVLATLHAFARGLPFDYVSTVEGPRGEHLFERETKPRNWFSLWVPIIAKPYDEGTPPLTGDVTTARAFLVNAGARCESATFGFLLRADETGTHSEWFWHCSCKTQYASVVSEAHLIACHTSLVSMLDYAITLGVDVIVRDETHYWETRDEARLVDEVREMNRIVAAFAGRFADAIEPAHSVHAPIFDHPRFERLEMGEQSE
jgi:hypothetical protein